MDTCDTKEVDATDNNASNGAIIALLRVLSYSKVKFVRYCVLDIGGTIRCKVIPLDFILQQEREAANKLVDGVAFVKACIGSFPSHADDILADAAYNTAAGTVRLRPDLSTLQILPYATDSAIVFGALFNDNTNDTNTSSISDLCCRSLLQSIIDEAKSQHKISFTLGVEIEFTLFDRTTNEPIDTSHFATMTTLNRQSTFIASLYESLQQQNIKIELLHTESSYGQMELVLEYSNNVLEIADHVILTRETIIAIAHRYNMKALFLPKVYQNQAGNGCHIHMSIQDITTGRNVFAETNQHHVNENSSNKNLISALGQQFIEGILEHLPSIMAMVVPSNNSFRRIGPGNWTGHSASWAVDDKNAPIRVIVDHHPHRDRGSSNTRFEFKLCDSIANVYLAISSLLIAGLDGISNQKVLRQPSSSASSISDKALPITLTESLNCLETNELFHKYIPKQMMKGYLAIRRAEAQYTSNLSLEDEVRSALERA